MSRFTRFLMVACLGVSISSLLAMNEEARFEEHVLSPSSYCRLRQTSKKFKLGIELQEISSLCPDMKDRFYLQKKPIFFVYSGNEKLWELQIDGDDIEFVTQPFSYDQAGSFIKCLKSISCAVRVLKESSYLPELTFRNWIRLLSQKFFDDTVDTCLVFENYRNKTVGSLLEYSLKMPEDWSPHFAPHVTIQHPLEWSIPLYALLFQHDSLSPSEIIFNMAVPLRREWLFPVGEYYKNKVLLAFISHKVVGLMFLNAFVLASMAAHVEDDDYKSIETIFDNYMKYGQFDAKMQSALVSRRPFSQMYSEVAGDLRGTIRCFNELLNLKKECAVSLLGTSVLPTASNALVETLRDRSLSSFHSLVQNQVKELLWRICSRSQSFNVELFKKNLQNYSLLSLEEIVPQVVKSYLHEFMSKEQVASSVTKIWYLVIKCLFNQECFECLNLDCFKELNEDAPYGDVFDTFLSYNSDFVDVSANFGKIDYGEQHYGDDGTYTMDLRFIYGKLCSNFKELGSNPLDRACRQLRQMTPHQVRVNYLLSRGILTLSMLRNLEIEGWDISSIGDNFYANVLTSISNPEAYKSRKVLNIKKAKDGEVQFDNEEYAYDHISPPLFLDTASDAMGHYKNILDVDKYGEAVIEVRTISNIGKPCLREMGISEKIQGNFLKDISNLEEHALALFNFLGNFEENVMKNPEQLRKLLDMSIGKKSGMGGVRNEY